VGCGANYLFPEAASALVRILEKMGTEIVIPKEQVCCGLPAYVSGDTDTARALAKRNIDLFSSLDLDAVLTVCASCGSHISHLETLFEDDPVWRDRARAVAQKHKDAMLFLEEDLGFSAHLESRGTAEGSHGAPSHRITYHDPCHLRIGQGVTDAPRKLIEALPGADFVEAPHSGRCCGHGGDFNLSHFDLSMDILDRRMKDLCKAKPHTIVTGCTGCLLQLAEGVSRKGLEGKVRVCHPLVLADEALRTPK
jgi:glycolate oxidase iron-sulfur subunit